MPYKNKADKRAHNMAVAESPEGQKRAAHRKGLERYRYRKAVAYERFKRLRGLEMPELIKDVSPECMANARLDVLASMGEAVEVVEINNNNGEI